MDEQVAAVEEVLEELGAGDKTVITALNKVDALPLHDPAAQANLQAALAEYPNAVALSALTGAGLDDLRRQLDRVARQQMAPVDVFIPYAQGELLALAHEHGFVELEEHGDEGTHLVGRLPIALAGRYAAYWTKKS